MKIRKFKNSVTIKKSADFRNTIQMGSLFKGRFFHIYFLEDCSQRVGFTAKRGISSVGRNRLKRLERELWCSCQDDYTVLGNCIVIGLDAALTAPFIQLKEDFKKILKMISSKSRPLSAL